MLSILDGDTLSAALVRGRPLFVGLGGALLVAGGLAMVLPYAAGVAFEWILAWAFLGAGVLQGVQSFRTRSWGGFAFLLVNAAVLLVGGAAMLIQPGAGLVGLTLIAVITFLADAAVKIALALRLFRRDGWGWFLLSGVASAMVAVALLSGLPATAAWAPGFLVGLDLFVTGLIFLRLAHLAGALRHAAA